MKFVTCKDIPFCECEAKKNCTCNVERKIMDMQGKNKVIDFLMGLDVKKFQGVIGNIIAMDPLPNLSKTYHIVQQAEKQMSLHDGVADIKENELSAFNVARARRSEGQYRESMAEKMKLRCDYCGKRGHVIKGCFELNGFPDWWKNPKVKGQSKFAVNVKREEIEDDPLSDVGEGSGSLTRPDKFIIDTVVQEVVKAMSMKQGSHASNGASSSFAGPL